MLKFKRKFRRLKVKERVKLYIHCPSLPLWRVIGRTLSLPFTSVYNIYIYIQCKLAPLSSTYSYRVKDSFAPPCKNSHIFWSRLISLAASFCGRCVRNWPVPLIIHVRVFNPTATSTCFTFKDFSCYRGDISLLRRTTDGFLWRDTYALVCGALPYCLSSYIPPAKPL